MANCSIGYHKVMGRTQPRSRQDSSLRRTPQSSATAAAIDPDLPSDPGASLRRMPQSTVTEVHRIGQGHRPQDT